MTKLTQKTMEWIPTEEEKLFADTAFDVFEIITKAVIMKKTFTSMKWQKRIHARYMKFLSHERSEAVKEEREKIEKECDKAITWVRTVPKGYSDSYISGYEKAYEQVKNDMRAALGKETEV